jgi:hypothetical protein
MTLALALASHRLRLHPSAPDGNCQFHSLALFFDFLSHTQMRAQVVQYIQQHADRFVEDIRAEYGCSVDAYCERMARLGTHGDGVTLQAFTLAFQVSVWLFMPTGVSRFGEFQKNIALIRQGDHYDAAIPI